MQIIDGRLIDAHWLSSPNFGERPDETEVSLLVVHNISLPPGQFGGGYVQQLFCNQLPANDHPYFDSIKGLQVSSHLLIERTGKTTQFVNFNQRAWHAGLSEFEGRENCNDFSIGIELEGTDTDNYTSEQYEQLIKVTQALQAAYPLITPERITGHEHIAPGRKTDPGIAFDWHRYREGIMKSI